MTGVAVLQTAAETTDGCTLYSSSAAGVAVIRTDMLPEAGPLALHRLLHLDVDELPPRNVAAQMTYGDIYRALLTRMRISEEIADRLYASAWVQVFYTAQEVQSMKKRWVRGVVAPPSSR